MKAELRGNPPSISLQNPNVLTTSQNPISGALTGCLSNLDGACIEKLLASLCKRSREKRRHFGPTSDVGLNNVASSTGDPNQRLASYFLRALISKASRVCPTTVNFAGGGGGGAASQRRLMSVTELAGYVDLIPWHSITYCMQWPTLIDALAKGCPKGPPLLRISVFSWRPQVPPLLNASIEEIGQRLSNFAKFKDVPFEFNIIEVDVPRESPSNHLQYDILLTQVNDCTLRLRADEALVVNCQNWLRYLPDEQMGSLSCRDSFLDSIKKLNPCVVTIVDEDCDLGASSGLASRITTCFNYMWIPFDALETFLSKNSPKRIEYESDIGHKIENVIGFEGFQRIERLESGARLSQRMGNKGFLSVPFCEETIKEVKVLLDEHASGWGMKRDEDMLILTWKGHNSIYATVWGPRVPSEINHDDFLFQTDVSN
ncbi:hypothetical protein DH2020_039657 [Rehmannia glutinosa]|uniref:Scarecrow-like protein n=1 Tax=Rehmannia glutinosa TaxID=99300 RepID=A0ABR0UXA5_REHGL